MKFDYIKIREGLYQRVIKFDEHNNLIYSDENSQGKTTLLRLLMHSIGYKIPNTKSIKFENCEVEIRIAVNGFVYTLFRHRDYIEVIDEKNEKTEFILPDEQDELHKVLFGIDNLDVLHNLLGCFYVDQEKGWTLLNRGTVIGSNKFNVESLLRGLADRDCQDIKKEIKKIENELAKFKKMIDLYEYQKQLSQEQGAIVFDNYDESIQKELDNLNIQKGIYEKELKSIKSSYDENQSFRKYIEKMKLYVIGNDGVEVPVNAKTIKNFGEINELLKARQRIIAAELTSINKRIRELDVIVEDTQIKFKLTDDIFKDFYKKISNISIDYISVKKLITKLEKRKSELNEQLTRNTKQNNEKLFSMYKNIEKYAKELSLEKYINLRTDFIFTHNLKELSGAILHKIVFAFKLGFIIEVEKYLGYKLPIVLDSPSGREVDKSNVEKMFEILNRDFSDHQVIVASIHDYDSFNKRKVHLIEERLINQEISFN